MLDGWCDGLTGTRSAFDVFLSAHQLADKIPERYKGQRKANKAVGNLAFPYSLYFTFYEQYDFIQVRTNELPLFRVSEETWLLCLVREGLPLYVPSLWEVKVVSHTVTLFTVNHRHAE